MYSGDDADMLEPEYSARDSLIAPPDVTFDQALTNAEYNLVANTVLAKADPDNVAQISSHSPALFKIPISFKDYYSLTARQWLNDEVIDYYNSLLNMRNREAYDAAVASNAAGGSGPLPPRCYWMKTNFYTFLNDAKEAGYNYSRVKRFTSKRNTKKFGMTDLWNQVDFVFVPINLTRSHWIMGMVNVRDQLFEMYDSMSSGDDQHVQRLQRWVIDEFKKIDKTDTSTPVSQWGIRIPGRDMVPQQRNGFDCGVFSTMFAKWRSQARDLPFGFDQSNMIHFRHRMALDIWQHEMAGSS
jgi:Ulp1 family protease